MSDWNAFFASLTAHKPTSISFSAFGGSYRSAAGFTSLVVVDEIVDQLCAQLVQQTQLTQLHFSGMVGPRAFV